MMKKVPAVLLVGFVLFLLTFSIALADKPTGFDTNGNENRWENTADQCWKISSGLIKDSSGLITIQPGFDEFGYNYQAHEFNGTYDSVDRNLDGTYWGSTGDYVDDKLMMHWSDEWLANEDCNKDGKLDRGLVNGVASGISKGWTTNHVEGDYIDVDGNSQHYTYFVKIGYTGSGPLWGSYTVVEEVYNDPAGGSTGLLDKTQPGLGQFNE